VSRQPLQIGVVGISAVPAHSWHWLDPFAACFPRQACNWPAFCFCSCVPSMQHHHLLNDQSGIPIPLQQVCMASDMGLGTRINMTPLASLQLSTSSDLRVIQCCSLLLHGACFVATCIASQVILAPCQSTLQAKLFHLQTRCTDPMLNCNVCCRVMALM